MTTVARSEPLRTHLCPRMSLYLGELELGVVLVHFPNLFFAGSTEHFDDFDELIHSGISRENWLAQKELSQNTPGGPNIC